MTDYAAWKQRAMQALNGPMRELDEIPGEMAERFERKIRAAFDELVEELTKYGSCPACGSAETESLLLPSRGLGTDERSKAYRCGQCGLRWTWEDQ